MLHILNWQSCIKISNKAIKNNTLVSGNAGGEKSLQPGSHKKFIFINLVELFK